MTKVLFVTRRDLLAVQGGDTLRALYLLELLGDTIDVTQIDIVYIGKKRFIGDFRDYSFSEKIGYLYNFNEPRVNLVLLARVAYSWIFNKSAFSFAFFESHEIDQFISSSFGNYDKIVYHLGRGVKLSQIRESDVIDLTDAISLNYSGISVRLPDFIKSPIGSCKKLLLKFDSNRVRATEIKIMGSGATVSFISDRDKNYLLNLADKNIDSKRIIVLPNKRRFLPEQPQVQRKVQERNQPSFLFIGNLRSIQNQDAVAYFLDHVLPLVNISMSQKYKLILAGSIPDNIKNIYKERKDVWVYGAFKNLDELRELNVIGVAPINIGAGLQNKVVDYIDISIDFVATSISVGGLSQVNELNLNVADTPETFCKSLCELIYHPTPYSQLLIRKRLCEHRFGRSDRDTIFQT